VTRVPQKIVNHTTWVWRFDGGLVFLWRVISGLCNAHLAVC